MTLTAIEPGTGIRHAKVRAGLANLDEFLASHPDLPLAAVCNPFDIHVCAGPTSSGDAHG